MIKFKKPMLAHTYDDYGHKVEYPVYIQPKLDGIRCISIKNGNLVELYTRSNNLIVSVPHINEALESLLTDGDVLDGELYRHGHDFNELSGDVRSTDGRNNSYIEYHIYDHPVVMSDHDYKQHERVMQLQQYKHNGQLITPLAYVDTFLIDSEESMIKGLNHFLHEGYEGVMLRSVDGLYESKRSTHLIKVKKFIEAEYQIIDMLEGTGKLKGHVGKFILQIPGSTLTFDCTAPGTFDNRKVLFDNWPATRGQFLTVKYQSLSKTGVPRFGTGKAIRFDI